MTDDAGVARENQRYGPVRRNVEFLKGEIENIPPDGSVDAIISNCVVNLSGEKNVCWRKSSRSATGEGAWRCPILSRGRYHQDPKESGIGFAWRGAGRDAGDLLRQAGFTGSESNRRASTRLETRRLLIGGDLPVTNLVAEVDGKFMRHSSGLRKPVSVRARREQGPQRSSA